MNVITLDVNAPREHFWKATKIYFDHPKCINKQIILSENVFAVEFESALEKSNINEIINELSCTYLKNENIQQNKSQSYFTVKYKHVDFDYVFEQTDGIFLLFRRLIPKLNEYNENEFYEFIILDKEASKIYFFTKCVKKNVGDDSFCTKSKTFDPLVVLKFKEIELSFTNGVLQLSFDNLGEKGINWLKAIFLKKFAKIMKNINNQNSRNKAPDDLFYSNIIDVVLFYKLYEEMKSKYAKFLIENWVEDTDPKKFVYEDIGIASYLMLLWNEGKMPENEFKKQKFIDLGCGNGLLVHILNSEGHLGLGLDMRKRKIWDIYDSNTVLKEEIIIPTNGISYLEVDWLIGNHSDELTAWIPIMARNKNCQYFVLPCCPYELNGQKFQRKNCNISSYQDFMIYVKQISDLCGFETYIDKLRIPSTKRTCLIGLNRHAYSESDLNKINKNLINFINEESLSNGNKKNCLVKNDLQGEISNNTTVEFKIRESTEKVRNCTKLSSNLINQILQSVMKTLLDEKQTCTVLRNNVIFNWNRGKKLAISKLAETISEVLLKQLKQECKGIQTLLKNHHYVFEVSQGYVQFRSPENLMEMSRKYLNTSNRIKWKKRSCWFYEFHPDKCPLSDELCSYSHKN